MSLVFGDSVERAVQHTVGMAWAHRTPEAMREAISRLEGMRTLLVFAGPDNQFDMIALGNEIIRCREAVEKLQRGEL